MKKTKAGKKETNGIINFYETIPKKYLDESENNNYEIHNI